MRKLPLEGIRILDLTLVWVGPYGTQILGDWGAEVIRMEPLQVFQPWTRGRRAHPGTTGIADYSNDYPNRDPGDRPWNRNVVFQIHGRNKSSATLDLPAPECLETFYRMANISDVIVENNVPSTFARLGITYEAIKRVRPDAVMVRVPAYGLNGPYRDYRAFGSHMEAAAGLTHLRGYPDLLPHTKGATFLADAIGGVTTAYAILTALTHRKKAGEGQLVEVPTTEACIPFIGEVIMDYAMNGRVRQTLGNRHPSRAPQGCYPCLGEDRWIVISIGSDEEWERLCQAMEEPEWAKDVKFSTVLGRYRNQDEIDRHISEWTRQHDHIDLMRKLQERGIPAGAIHDQRELFEDPHMQERDFFEELYQPATGTHKYAGFMWKMKNIPNRIRRPSPMLGEHNEWVYKELLGLTEEEYRTLERAGHIGMDYPAHVP